MLADQPLATFVDRHTMTYERRYAHPIRRVWEAVTTAEHLEVWLLPETRVERRLGGACAFGWGGPADAEVASRGRVTDFDEPAVVTYAFEDSSWMRFELSAAGESTTLLRFTLFFPAPAQPPEDAEFPGGDHPAPGTAWQPGFLAGFHEMLDQLDGFLVGTWTRAHNDASLVEYETGRTPAEHLRLIDLYRDRIVATIPPE